MKKMIKIAISLSTMIVCMFGLSISVNANYSNYNYTYTTTQDTAYSSNANPNTNGKILVFGRPICGRTNYTLDEIAESDWIETANIDIACINCDNADKATVLKHEELIDFNLITFCYGDAPWYGYSKYIPAAEKASKNYSLPIMVYIDKNDTVIAVTSGFKTSDEIYYTMFGEYPKERSRSLENCNIEGVSLTYEYTGKPIDITKDVKIYSEKGRTLRRSHYSYYDAGKNYYHVYTSCGKYSLKIQGKGKYEGTSVEVVYYIVPSKTKIKKITSSKSNYITVKYNGSTGADGYQLVCSSDAKFPAKLTRKIKTKSSDELTIKCDKGTYYFKIRPYIVEDGKRIFGKWSDIYEYTVT
ncbi:MAG: hypothetical protein NC452_02365 [Eubacterium sp.]|nr:hypothetical protein [Eubacterium sp.]